MKKLFMILSLVFLLCFTFSCQQSEEVAEKPMVDSAKKEAGPTITGASFINCCY